MFRRIIPVQFGFGQNSNYYDNDVVRSVDEISSVKNYFLIVA